MTRLPSICLVLAVSAAACGNDEPGVSFEELSDRDYVGGDEVTRVVVDDTLIAASVDLYLDNLRVAEKAFAPYELAWSALPFKEGVHELRARVRLADGSYEEAAVVVQVDNTPPVLGPLPTTATRGEDLAFTASDNGAIDAIAVKVGGRELSPGDAAHSVRWEAACGATSGVVKVIDKAGMSTSAPFTVVTTDTADRDCDGHRATDRGGDDCDDTNAEIHPGASDTVTEDRTCDGVLGTDADNDGVLSLLSGGSDCDDRNPSIHPGRLRYQRTEIGDLSLHDAYAGITVAAGLWHLFKVEFTDEHPIRVRTPLGDGTVSVQPVADGSNAALAVAHEGDHILLAYGLGHDLVIARGGGQDWTRETIHGTDDVSDVKLDIDPVSHAVAVAYSVGKTLRLSTNASGAWVSRDIDTQQSVSELRVRRSRGGVTVAYVIDGALWKGAWSGSADEAVALTAIDDYSRGHYCGDPAIDEAGEIYYAVFGASGGVFHDRVKVMASSENIYSIAAVASGTLLVQPARGPLRIIRPDGKHYVDDGVTDFVAADGQTPLDGNGVFVTNKRVYSSVKLVEPGTAGDCHP